MAVATKRRDVEVTLCDTCGREAGSDLRDFFRCEICGADVCESCAKWLNENWVTGVYEEDDIPVCEKCKAVVGRYKDRINALRDHVADTEFEIRSGVFRDRGVKYDPNRRNLPPSHYED